MSVTPKAYPQPIFVVGKRQHGKTVTALELAFTRIRLHGYEKLYVFSRNQQLSEHRADQLVLRQGDFDHGINFRTFSGQHPAPPDEIKNDSAAIGVFLDLTMADPFTKAWLNAMDSGYTNDHGCLGQLIFELSFNDHVYYQH